MNRVESAVDDKLESKTVDITLPVLVILALITVCLAARWLVFDAREIAPGVTARPLKECDLLWFSKRQALVLACPGVDLVRLWPWPPMRPWVEEPELGGLLAGGALTERKGCEG